MNCARFEIQIAVIQIDKLGFAQTGVKQAVQDGAVALADVGTAACGDHAAHIVERHAGEWVLLDLGRLHLGDEALIAGIVDLQGEPPEKSAYGAIRGVNAAGIALFGEVQNIPAQMLGFELLNMADFEPDEEALKSLQLGLVIFERARREAPRLAVHQEGGDLAGDQVLHFLGDCGRGGCSHRVIATECMNQVRRTCVLVSWVGDYAIKDDI